jgi:hypothetical protein
MGCQSFYNSDTFIGTVSGTTERINQNIQKMVDKIGHDNGPRQVIWNNNNGCTKDNE